MVLAYADLRTDAVQGNTLADYLVGVEADLRILDEGRIVYEEPSRSWVWSWPARASTPPGDRDGRRRFALRGGGR